jgi:antitoxin (DNA-binding transcriptional repressor) of toxin-antitoxin stability system
VVGDVSIRDLRNHGGEIVERAEAGEDVTITRAGTPVAQLRALPRQALTAEALLRRWRRLPQVDPVALRADLDALLDPRL